MCADMKNDLGLTDSSCSCSAHSGTPAIESNKRTTVTEPSMAYTFQVAGMTCSHCVESVTSEVGRVAGAERIDVDLVPGGLSRVTVSSNNPVDPAAIAAAIDEAGYELILETP
ncbi:heavy-metal-associated domain-containing protein [Cryobacterium sp. 1639]|nr:heavy-metal-associated domain-containing protein [Cryobacterium sp. 1639]